MRVWNKIVWVAHYKNPISLILNSCHFRFSKVIVHSFLAYSQNQSAFSDNSRFQFNSAVLQVVQYLLCQICLTSCQCLNIAFPLFNFTFRGGHFAVYLPIIWLPSEAWLLFVTPVLKLGFCFTHSHCTVHLLVRGKVFPLQAWAGPWGIR